METALVKVFNDVLLNMNSQQATLLVLLDLSVIFDTNSHDILLERLHKDIGMHGVTLDWFHSYLSNRYEQVCIDRCLYNQRYLNFGVPWGSCLGPLPLKRPKGPYCSSTCIHVQISSIEFPTQRNHKLISEHFLLSWLMISPEKTFNICINTGIHHLLEFLEHL